MIRQLKFRVWSKVAQCMIEWDEVQYKPHTIFDNSNWIPMQFTGLKDKNGTDIYEGDNMSHPEFADDAILTVKFSDGCYYLNVWDCTSTDFTKGEVIGNIHE
jgi:hypothetical protein